MKTFTPVTSRIQTITRSHGRGPLQDAACPRATMLDRRLALPLFFLCAALLVQLCAATPFQWEYTGSLNTARQGHTATLLSQGRVLVAGGWGLVGGNSGALASAELYHPATGKWTLTGSLNAARSYHTATLLPNGEVLVAGGVGSDFGSLGSAELYDPATGTWTFTGSLNTGRSSHTATLLADGKVLVVGGFIWPFTELGSAELYDPATGTWTFTGSLNVARSAHTATLLSDGRVLVAGGGVPSPVASAELYDPTTATWTLTGSLNTARAQHTATLLTNGHVLVAGGAAGPHLFASTELYDPATGIWGVTGSLNIPRVLHTATLLPNGEVLVVAGNFNGFLARAELYDPGVGVVRKLDGRGAVDNQGNQVTFNFRASQSEAGTVVYFSFCDPAAGVCIREAKTQSLSINGNTAAFSGQAHLEDGSKVKFTVSVTDNGEPGTSDTISINLTNGYSAGGTLISGDIRIQ